MKSIIADNGTFGPFSLITIHPNHYVADGIKFQFDVIGGNRVIADYVPVDPPLVVPKSITMKQARMALYSAGKLTDVNSAIMALTGEAGDLARIQWEFASEIDRGYDLVNFITALLGWSESETDSLFIAAAQII